MSTGREVLPPARKPAGRNRPHHAGCCVTDSRSESGPLRDSPCVLRPVGELDGPDARPRLSPLLPDGAAALRQAIICGRSDRHLVASKGGWQTTVAAVRRRTWLHSHDDGVGVANDAEAHGRRFFLSEAFGLPSRGQLERT